MNCKNISQAKHLLNFWIMFGLMCQVGFIHEQGMRFSAQRHTQDRDLDLNHGLQAFYPKTIFHIIFSADLSPPPLPASDNGREIFSLQRGLLELQDELQSLKLFFLMRCPPNIWITMTVRPNTHLTCLVHLRSIHEPSH